MAKNTFPEWISADEAAQLAGFRNVATFERYVRQGELKIRRSKLTHKSAVRYDKNDILFLLNQKASA